jgi:D-alanyl-lipoteichoic acid acyltransferase DltB (MBOAT superfamily)
MLFNSLQFIVFFVFVYVLYLFLGRKAQNRMLLVASYVFYGSWDWRFLSLIFASTCVDYICGRRIEDSANSRHRRILLITSVVVNLGLLGFFKYCDFFVDSFISLLGLAGIQANAFTLNIILPVGISFYTFQTMCYTIDVHGGKMKAERDFFDFALYVSFFPQLVAGPIERASRLLPQIVNARVVHREDVREGLWLISFGYFQKVFVADNLAATVDRIFAAPEPVSGSQYLTALYAFAFQILGDFGGYSSIAAGISRLMGIRLMTNFLFPYFVTNPRDFWKNWHISLSTWLRDYLYVPLGGNRGSIGQTYRNLMVTMILGGLWHGAAWTFVLWGTFHGLLLVGQRIMSATKPGRMVAGLDWWGWTVVKALIMFHVTCLGWLLFRARSMRQVWQVLRAIIFDFPGPEPLHAAVWGIALYILPLLVILAVQKRAEDPMAIARMPVVPRWLILCAMYALLAVYGRYDSHAFIYFQF